MSGYESCAGCGDPVIRAHTTRMAIFCAWCVEAAKELGIDLEPEGGDVSENDLAKLAGMREAILDDGPPIISLGPAIVIRHYE